MEDVPGFLGGVPGFLGSVPGFLGVFRVLRGVPGFLGVPGCSSVPVFLEVTTCRDNDVTEYQV